MAAAQNLYNLSSGGLSSAFIALLFSLLVSSCLIELFLLQFSWSCFYKSKQYLKKNKILLAVTLKIFLLWVTLSFKSLNAAWSLIFYLSRLLFIFALPYVWHTLYCDVLWSVSFTSLIFMLFLKIISLDLYMRKHIWMSHFLQIELIEVL